VTPVVVERDVDYAADGTVMRGHLAVPDVDGPVPGVLVAPEANGLDEYQMGRARMLAELGYTALALDYYGDRKVFTSRDQMMAELADLAADPDRIRSRGRAGLEALLAEASVDASKVAAIGFCFGETVVMELARTGADLKAVVGFHPGLNILRPGDSRHIRAKVLMCVGADDPVVPPEQLRAFEEEMRSAGLDWRIIRLGGVQHSFTHPRAGTMGLPGLKYDAVATERSWRAMLDLFDETF
jgi:dienelactone hydrolase